MTLGSKQANIQAKEFEGVVLIGGKRQMRLFDARHDMHQTTVFEPLQGGFVIFAARAFLQLGIDKLLVFFCQLFRNRIP